MYNCFQREGAFSILSIVTTAPTGDEIDVWALTDQSPSAVGAWDYGQAEIYAHKVAFFALKVESLSFLICT